MKILSNEHVDITMMLFFVYLFYVHHFWNNKDYQSSTSIFFLVGTWESKFGWYFGVKNENYFLNYWKILKLMQIVFEIKIFL